MSGTRSVWIARGQVAVAMLFIFGVAGVLIDGALRSPAVPLLIAGDTPWISVRFPPRMKAIFVDQTQPPASVFERRFVVDPLPGAVRLRVRAMRDLALTLNSKPVPLDGRDPAHWKDAFVVDVTALLVPGENLLRAEVRNPVGPPFLQLRIEGVAPEIATDTRWSAAPQGGFFEPAVVADDDVRHPDSLVLPSPGVALASHVWLLAGIAVVGGILALLVRGQRRIAAIAPVLSIGLLAVYWLWFFVEKITAIPAYLGFDASHHLQYIIHLVQHGTLPRASDGMSMYHPPLYHATTAALLNATGVVLNSTAGRVVFSLLPALAGFGMALVAGTTSRWLVPGNRWLEAGAVLFAGLLPMNLTLAACVSNESLHALLASLAVLLTLRSLVVERTSFRQDVVLGLMLSAALLTKYSSALLVPILIGAVAAKRVIVEEAPLRRVASGVVIPAFLIALLAGWFYVRNWQLYGDPFVWNMNATAGRTWWQVPGFHTPAYFFRFGEVLLHPWYCGFTSFWDPVYSTLWGDGMLSGVAAVASAHRFWRYDWMAAGFALALPATVLMAGGWLRAAGAAARDADPRKRLAFSLIVLLPPVLLASLLQVNMRLPFWSLGKAFYALFLTPTLGFLAAFGFDAVAEAREGRWWIMVRGLIWGWAAAFMVAIGMAYGG